MNNFSNISYNKIPILIIAFNRPKYLDNLIKTLRFFSPERVFIAVDGPRKDNFNDMGLCEEVIKIINTKINWKCKIEKKFEKKNLGTKKAVYDAISWFFDNVKMGIILEDDIDPDLSFFHFCEKLLLKYKDTKNVKMISGNYYLEKENLIKESYYFSQTPATHGWATWKRAWNDIDINMKDWTYDNKFISTLKYFKFNLSRSHYFYKKFDLTYNNKIDTWDYQFFYSIIKNNGLIIKPHKNLCKHIGWGSDATRGKGPDTFPEIIKKRISFPLIHPTKILVNNKLDKKEDIKVRKLNFINYFFYLFKKKVIKQFRH